MIEEQGRSESCLRIRASSSTTNKPKLIIRFARSNQLGFLFFSPLMPAVWAAVDQKQLLPASALLEINSVSSITHTVAMGNVSWTDDSIAVPYRDWYYVQAKVSIGNLVGADIQVNERMNISVSLNKAVYCSLISVLAPGITELFVSYCNAMDDFWIRNLGSSIIPWNNGNNPLYITFSGWLRR